MKKQDFGNIAVNYYYGSRITLSPKWGMKNEVCGYAKIYFVFDGSFVLETGGAQKKLVPGDMLLLPPGVKHSYHIPDGTTLAKCWLHFNIISGGVSIFDRIKLPLTISYPAAEISVRASVFDRIYAHSDKSGLLSAIIVNQSVLEILADYIRCAGGEKYTGSAVPFETVKNYISGNLDKKLSLKSLAQLASLHPNYLVRSFKQATGLPPIKYINALKLEKAKALLENTDTPISEIMALIGFYDDSHFSAFFKNHTGFSPHKFRHIYGKYIK